MHSYAQIVLLIFKGVARCARAAFRPVTHHSPTSGAWRDRFRERFELMRPSDRVMTRPAFGCRSLVVNACLEPVLFSNRLLHLDRYQIRTDGLRSPVRYRETCRVARF